MSFSLTLPERYDLIHQVARLPSTVNLRFDIDAFQKLIDFSREEIIDLQIEIDRATFEVKARDLTYCKDFDKLPDGVIESIKIFISKYDIDDMKTNKFVQDALDLYKKVI